LVLLKLIENYSCIFLEHLTTEAKIPPNKYPGAFTKSSKIPSTPMQTSKMEINMKALFHFSREKRFPYKKMKLKKQEK
jgi:hypothetical protein